MFLNSLYIFGIINIFDIVLKLCIFIFILFDVFNCNMPCNSAILAASWYFNKSWILNHEKDIITLLFTKLFYMDTDLSPCNWPKILSPLVKKNTKCKGSQLDSFSPWGIVYCYLEFKLSYLKNLKLFSITVNSPDQLPKSATLPKWAMLFLIRQSQIQNNPIMHCFYWNNLLFVCGFWASN